MFTTKVTNFKNDVECLFTTDVLNYELCNIIYTTDGLLRTIFFNLCLQTFCNAKVDKNLQIIIQIKFIPPDVHILNPTTTFYYIHHTRAVFRTGLHPNAIQFR